ncbi:tRNA preQ1(34) S-adenosylmethionine ribosyltransferase-isomerase QueA [Candidatus Fokinia crypta]|uniref:S-adenosylmethionine:tRNA ribosyltransferase-isomerase n=1 Tax=Candidatus Fokinia crypta TaxID=1920990 RepID=A0ABZ0USJ1_9RICK|nr:tRNA preQ1(34) S-adenosylmethionine ribosyltransferase-isomerase QueA [Candidatus Fokinia cryptica]WPX98118.1 S-adenosylmethionine:tRNA ribosyltransferase-isomerase [Candidatus Fokinia cryptica]
MNITTEEFYFHLPHELIARHPVEPRDSSRLLHMNKEGMLEDLYFRDVIKLLKKNDVLVLNNTKVIPSMLKCCIKEKNTKVRVDILKHYNKCNTLYCDALITPKKHCQQNVILECTNDNTTLELSIEEVEKNITTLKILSDENFHEIMKKYGNVPLPPYIIKARSKYNTIENQETDTEHYQTVYARHDGSIAAPTAGLHFTDTLLTTISEMGVQICYITLHVGLGTFLPINTPLLSEHKMHEEIFEVTQDTINTLQNAKERQSRIVAVGTTSVRVLEHIAQHNISTASIGTTDIFISPGYKFKTVNSIITNFHMSKSTPLVLVCSAAGKERIFHMYKHAIENKYRMLSYGDACMIDIVTAE